ncbi:MAG: GntR family transcriptional regulator [Balneolaceae bacterium]
MINNSVPRHQQITDHLRSDIKKNEFLPGDKLPSEKRLCDYFDVSRITVRQALKALENEGLIFKKQGLGSFVSEEKSSQPLVQLTDFSEDMRRAGFESSSKLIRFKKVKPIVEINTILELPPTSPLIQIDRVRLGNETPVAFDITWLPGSYGQLLLDEDLTKKTIYQILEETYAIPISAGKYKFTATLANEYIAKHLHIVAGSPIFEIDRCSRTTGGKKVYFQKRYNNPGLISYEIELFRSDESNESCKDGLPLKEFIPKFNF